MKELLFCVALVRADSVAKQADVVAALTIECLLGSVRAFDQGRVTMATLCSHMFVSSIHFGNSS